MKNLLKPVAFLFLSMTFLISSCSNDDSATTIEDPIVEDPIVEDPIVVNEFMTAKIDGVQFTATGAFDGSILTSGPSRSLKVAASNGSGLRFTIILMLNAVEEGTYQVSLPGFGSVNLINGTTSPNLMWLAPTAQSTIFQNYGEITITSFSDTEVSGTFECTLTSSVNDSTKEITEGSFNIAL